MEIYWAMYLDKSYYMLNDNLLPMAEQVGWDTPCLLWSLGVREVMGSRPGRGNSKESFSSNQETAKLVRVSLLKCPSIPNYKKIG